MRLVLGESQRFPRIQLPGGVLYPGIQMSSLVASECFRLSLLDAATLPFALMVRGAESLKVS